jgi:membrane-associated phospholipid phosphatase
VTKWADWASYGTAFVNPTVATIEALRSEQKTCRLGRIALSEGIANGLGLTMKHFILSPRPCLGCAPDGFPSGHSANSMIGSGGWRYGIVFGAATGSLRMEANRHTPTQVAAGLLLGAGAEFAGRLIHCP